MWIKRLQVSHWRGLEALELTGLSPHLNLIAGPNESGKSRLVEALRFALFESSKGAAQYKQDLRSWGLIREQPTVAVEFELAGTVYRIDKAFLGTGTNTRLRSPTESLEGEAAEGRLASLLGVHEPGSREVKASERGIWPLLWVDQGQSFVNPGAEANADAHQRLQDVLTREVGEVAAGEQGQLLLAATRERAERYYTPGRGAERGALLDLRRKMATLGQELETARERRDAIASDAEQLGRLDVELRDLGARTRVTGEQLQAVRARVEQARRLGEQVGLNALQADNAAATLAREQAAYAQWQALEAGIGSRRETINALQTELDTASAQRHQAQADRQLATGAVDRAEATLREATATLAALRRRADAQRARDEHARLRTQLDAVQQVEAQIRALHDTRLTLPDVDGKAVTALRELHDAAASARARLEGASASVRVHAERELTVDGSPLAAGQARNLLVDDERLISIEGIARITVSPGGGELARLRDAQRDAEAALRGRLAALGVTDLRGAERSAELRRDLDRDLGARQAELSRLAPAGADALALHLRQVATRFDPGDTGDTGDTGDPVDSEALDSAEASATQTRTDLEHARARRDAGDERLRERDLALARLQARLAGAQDELAEQTRQRETLPGDDALRARVEEAERERQLAQALHAQSRQDFEALGGKRLTLALEQAEKAHQQLTEQVAGRRREQVVLQERLRGAGEDARHERVQALEADLAQAETDLARLLREAGAARRLQQVLDAAARAARERLTRPVIEQIRPYLGELFPDAEPWLDDELRLLGLRAGARDEHFDFLSAGAREQLGLLVRIGLAEVLGSEEPWPLVLDDALVNTDPERTARMQRVLYQASRRTQILLFTCHGALFDALGADRHQALAARRHA